MIRLFFKLAVHSMVGNIRQRTRRQRCKPWTRAFPIWCKPKTNTQIST